MTTLSFFAQEKQYDPLPAPCGSCGHVVGVVTFRDKALVGFKCQKCGADLDRSLVRTHPLRQDCRCGESETSGVGFIVPQRNNPDGQALHCINCGTWIRYVPKAELGAAPDRTRRPEIPEHLKYQIRLESGFKCQINHEVTELHMGHCLSVADNDALVARRVSIALTEEELYGYWNLYATCRRCNEGMSGRGESVLPSLYIQLKPGEFDKPRKDRNPAFTKVLLALGEALTLRKEAA